MKQIAVHLRSKKGESLVEVLIALAVLALLSGSIVTTVLSCFKTNTEAKKLTDTNMNITAGIDGDKTENYSETQKSSELKIQFDGKTIIVNGKIKTGTDSTSDNSSKKITYFVPD